MALSDILLGGVDNNPADRVPADQQQPGLAYSKNVGDQHFYNAVNPLLAQVQSGKSLTPQQRDAVIKSYGQIQPGGGLSNLLMGPSMLSGVPDAQLLNGLISHYQSAAYPSDDTAAKVALMIGGSLAGAGIGSALSGGAAATTSAGMTTSDATTLAGMTEGAGVGSTTGAGLSNAGTISGASGFPTLAGSVGADTTLGTSAPSATGATGATGATMPTGVDASTGAYAGESANSGAGTYGMGGGGATGAPLPAGGAAYTTPLSRVLAGNGSTADWLSLGGTTLATGLGIYGANQQSNALHDQYSQYLGLGAPSRARYEASFSPNFKLSDIPGYQDALNTTTDTLLRRASTGGNPAGNPGVLAEINRYVAGNLALPTLEQYRNQNAATGGYGAFNSAAPGLGTASINAGAGSLNAAGYGINQLTNPMPTLDQLFRQSQPQNSLA